MLPDKTPRSKTQPLSALPEGERIMTVCNACRYCEGFCAVFPAMERRIAFTPADLDYLANLCHNCGECYYACQYAPPHEFAINVPQTLAQIRLESYRRNAWPAPLAALFGTKLWIVLAALLAGLGVAIGLRKGGSPTAPGDFYTVMPHEAMVILFGSVSVFLVTAFAAGLIRFWRHMGEQFPTFGALKNACKDVLQLTYLSSGGAGCTYPDERHSQARRWFHHLTFYGFMLCFAATSVAALYHYLLHWKAPYQYFSLPVILGTLGGIGLLAGPLGLFALKQRHDPALCDKRQYGMDVTFLVLLFLTSLTGLLLLALRERAAMSVLLAIHLGCVLLLFLTLPYGKFVHGIYRSAALVRYALEQSRPFRATE